jgi:hypothetical protein
MVHAEHAAACSSWWVERWRIPPSMAPAFLAVSKQGYTTLPRYLANCRGVTLTEPRKCYLSTLRAVLDSTIPKTFRSTHAVHGSILRTLPELGV